MESIESKTNALKFKRPATLRLKLVFLSLLQDRNTLIFWEAES